jgi:hypothetical protein
MISRLRFQSHRDLNHRHQLTGLSKSHYKTRNLATKSTASEFSGHSAKSEASGGQKQQPGATWTLIYTNTLELGLRCQIIS